MNKKKIIKSVVYFLGEITIVTIGIFIAFQLNNYNEDKKTKNNEISSLKRLLSDLETEKTFLVKTKRNFIRKRAKLNAIVFDGNRTHLDSLYFYIAHGYMHYDFNTEYSTLKFSGSLNLISNDSLRYNLVKYYERGYAYSKEISKNHLNYMKDHLVITLDEIPIDTTYLYKPAVIEEKLKDDAFIETVTTQMMWYRENLKALKVDQVENLIEIVTNELKVNSDN
ncbi:hypothetical protein [Chondrinema litorale]|uniref:hypothetical protein n=1 Tax=Chondrinema litorale TaxID=2994555 RepID=UPI00254310F2|nr:hypothetical protein [Chondrinema litorale]UZR99726.1 hypothetical protein OQ292_38190 [Chondrinema litorale]